MSDGVGRHAPRWRTAFERRAGARRAQVLLEELADAWARLALTYGIEPELVWHERRELLAAMGFYDWRDHEHAAQAAMERDDDRDEDDRDRIPEPAGGLGPGRGAGPRDGADPAGPEGGAQ